MALGLGILPALVALGTANLGAAATSTRTAAPAEGAAPAATSAQVGAAGDVASRFAGSALLVQLSANLNVFDAGLQLMQNPTVDSFLMLTPRYQATDWLALRGRFSLAFEFTEADATTFEHELQVGDGMVGALYTGIPSFLGVKANVGAQVTLPLSKVSRAKTLYFAPAVTADLSRAFEGVGGGALSLKALGSYARPVYGEITPRVLTSLPYVPRCYGGLVECSDQLSGAANVRDLVTWGLVGSGAWGKLSTSLSFTMAHQFPFQFSDLPGVTRGEARPSVRMISSVSLGVGYDLTDYVNVELSYSMMRDLMAGDGTWGSPFYDRNQDMRLNLGATLELERLYRLF